MASSTTGISRPQPSLPRELPRLTSLRAFAALAVFALHLGRWHVLTLPGASAGYVGVCFFFMLSGFVLTWTSQPAVTSRSNFYRRRFARIYPSHFATWLVAFAVPVLANPITVPGAVSNLFLVQSWWPTDSVSGSMNGVTWSLSCEAFFYALFPMLLLFLNRRSTRSMWATVASLWVVASAAVLLLGGLDRSWEIVVYKNPAIRFAEFAVGVAIAISVRRGWRLNLPVAIALVLPAIVGLAFRRSHFAIDVWAVPIFVVILMLAIDLDLRRKSGLLTHKWLIYCGKVSFCFYLVHELIIINLRHAWPEKPGAAVAVVALATSCAAAVLLHHFIEHPFQKLFSGSSRNGRHRPTEIATSAA